MPPETPGCVSAASGSAIGSVGGQRPADALLHFAIGPDGRQRGGRDRPGLHRAQLLGLADIVDGDAGRGAARQKQDGGDAQQRKSLVHADNVPVELSGAHIDQSSRASNPKFGQHGRRSWPLSGTRWRRSRKPPKPCRSERALAGLHFLEQLRGEQAAILRLLLGHPDRNALAEDGSVTPGRPPSCRPRGESHRPAAPRSASGPAWHRGRAR